MGNFKNRGDLCYYFHSLHIVNVMLNQVGKKLIEGTLVERSTNEKTVAEGSVAEDTINKNRS